MDHVYAARLLPCKWPLLGPVAVVGDSTAFLPVEAVTILPDSTKLCDESRLFCSTAMLTAKSSMSSSAWFAVVAIVVLRVCFSELEMEL